MPELPETVFVLPETYLELPEIDSASGSKIFLPRITGSRFEQLPISGCFQKAGLTPLLAMPPPRLKVMISSTVHGFEDQLDQIAVVLSRYGYEVLMSHFGTIPPIPGLNNFEACLAAVDVCDYFVGIIRGYYGSGKAAPSGLSDNQVSITHAEQRRAIERDKPRSFLVEEKVANAWQLLRPLLDRLRSDPVNGAGVPIWDLQLSSGERNPLADNGIVNDLRAIAMYEEALLSQTSPSSRHDHWCQAFRRLPEILRFIQARFEDHSRLYDEIQNARSASPE